MNIQGEVILSLDELKEIRSVIWRNTGIYIEDSKVYLLEYKIKGMIKDKGISPREYIKILNNSAERELSELINQITIGETQFFRDKIQFDVFFDRILKKLIEEKRRSFLHILSAGCATGEEVYTLSIYMLEKFPLVSFRIIGVDINDKFIERAKKGLYNTYSMRGVPPPLIPKYFEKIGADEWKVKDILKYNVVFERVNLMDKVRVKMLGKFDAIVCRNVVIYFDEESRNKLAETFWSILSPGGYLMLGPAERIPSITAIFEPVFEGNMFFYRKPEKPVDTLM